MALGQNPVEHNNYEKTLALPTNCLRSNETELCKQFILIQALNDELKEKKKMTLATDQGWEINNH